MTDNITKDQSEKVRQAVRDGYGQIARTGSSERVESGCCGSDPAAQPSPSGGSSCCGTGAAEELAQSLGYSEAELATLPEGANLGLSCGNPTAIASLLPGETVLDLGSGGGFDLFIAGQKVGSSGRAIGIDMTSDMLDLARRNLVSYRERSGLDNVEFRLGEIEHLPVADNSVDVIISNCVINLSPNKSQVWREMARVLKPGGRVAVSDLALRKALPAAIEEMVEALVGCIAGAVFVSDSERMMREVNLTDIQLKEDDGYMNMMAKTEDPLYQKIMDQLPAGDSPGDFITSLSISARKPA
jgi:arsenite methyltransferase